jgi:hypothetical protein
MTKKKVGHRVGVRPAVLCAIWDSNPEPAENQSHRPGVARICPDSRFHLHKWAPASRSSTPGFPPFRNDERGVKRGVGGSAGAEPIGVNVEPVVSAASG